MQFHGGVYRSDDGGGNWLDIGEGLPSDFGFPVVVDPADADSAYVIPLIGAEDRTPPNGAVRVWETRDAGATWQARGDGLPERAYLTILRAAFDNSGEGEGLELYFGATSGEVFGSKKPGELEEGRRPPGPGVLGARLRVRARRTRDALLDALEDGLAAVLELEP